MERCHGLCNQFFWSRHQFATRQEVQRRYPDFLHQMRHAYAVPDQPGVTPAQLRQQLPDQRVRSLDSHYSWSEGRKVPLVAGTVHCVRLTNAHAHLSAFGRNFTLDETYRHSYIRASLAVAEQCLRFFFQSSAEATPQLIATRPFQLPDPVYPYDTDLAADLLL